MRKRGLALTVLLTGVCLCLGLTYWQWLRGLEKSEIIKRGSLSARHWSANDTVADAAWRPYTLSGRFVPAEQFLLTHQIVRRRPGYVVLTPFQPACCDQIIMVNRGWMDSQTIARVPGVTASFPGVMSSYATGAPTSTDDYSRQTDALLLQTLNDAQAAVDITGIAVPYSDGFRLGVNTIESVGDDRSRLHAMLYPDFGDISAVLGQQPVGVVIVLDDGQPGALEHIKHTIPMSTEKHWAYAVQWLLLATLQAVIAIVYWRRTSAPTQPPSP
ncbi:MAG: SURF1 family protein [Gammaproteobacteria bacterium]|nr:SURF1 family protein [Gammaproteobacteria bacterium]